jgi:hypothetical protein
VWERLCDLDREETAALVKRFMEEQPAVGVFLSASSEILYEKEAERSPVVDLVIACWQAMVEVAGHPLKTVTPDDLEQAEDANANTLQRLEEGSEIEGERAARESFQKYNQRELLGFGIEMLMSGHEENPELAPDSVGLEMLWLKTVLDCLDQAAKE